MFIMSAKYKVRDTKYTTKGLRFKRNSQPRYNISPRKSITLDVHVREHVY